MLYFNTVPLLDTAGCGLGVREDSKPEVKGASGTSLAPQAASAGGDKACLHDERSAHPPPARASTGSPKEADPGVLPGAWPSAPCTPVRL